MRKLLLLLVILLTVHLTFGQVTNETMRQIRSLLDEKASRTFAQKKLDSRLLQAVKERRGEPMARGVVLDKADVKADNSGNLKIDINGDITSNFLSKVRQAGGKIIFASPGYHTVRVEVNLSAVEAIATFKEVQFIQPAVRYMLVGNGLKNERERAFDARAANVRAKLQAYLDKNSGIIGSVTSQGDAAHRAADVRSTFGYKGQGIKIGVLSDSYNAKSGAAADVTNGDLPGPGNPDGYTTPVTVVQDYSGGEDEGRAMLQVIHDLAPAATLYFATADVSEAGFASSITTLRNTYNCNIILDDVAYFDEPAFQDGVVAQAVNTVTASGALYFSSAGNSGALAKGTSGVFEGDFNDAGSLSFSGSTKAGTIHNFGTTSSPVNGDIIKAVGEVYNLIWSDPWGASSNDYDLFLVSSAGKVKASSTTVQNGTQNPYEQISARALVSGDRLVVFKTSGAAVRALHLNTNRGTLTVATNGQTTGHACAVNAFCMAAAPAAGAFEAGYPTGPYPGAFVSTNKLEPFSSDGPRRIFYNADGSSITSGNVLFGTNGGSLRAKPDLTAADGVSTTLAASSGLNPFYGTSCAAPHAGAIAALVLSANPSLTAAQVRNILTSTALDIEGTGYDINSGYGIMQAYQAAQQVNPASCGVPVGLTASAITSSSATISWSAVSGATSYDADYKIHTATTWTNAATGTTSVTVNLTGLTANTLYDYRVRSNCSAGTSAYDTAQFTTTAAALCTAPTGLTASSVTTSSATVSWTAVSGATGYNLQYKTTAGSTFTTVTGLTNASYSLTGLSAGTSYQFQVQTICSGGAFSSYSNPVSFTTAANSITYCASGGTTTYEYISKVVLGSISNTSGNDGGYGNYSSLSTNLSAGSSYTITLTPGFASTKYVEDWTVYIDYNQDGTLNGTGETVLKVASTKTGIASGSFKVPSTAINGSTRLRIQMHYGSYSTNPCGTLNYGEVEDYSVNISGGTGSGFAQEYVSNTLPLAIKRFAIYPNPVSGSSATVDYSLDKPGKIMLRVLDLLGRTAQAVDLGTQAAGAHTYTLNRSEKLQGNYFIVLYQNNEMIGRNKILMTSK